MQGAARVPAGVPGGAGDLGEDLAQARTPRGADHAVLRIAAVDRYQAGHAQRIGFVHHHVERHSHRDVAAKRGIHRYPSALGRLVQSGIGGDPPIEDRLALLELADLEVWTLVGGL